MQTRLAAFLSASLLPTVAMAQAAPAPSMTGIDVQNFWPAAGPSQAIVLRSSDVQPHLSIGFSLIGNYMERPLVFQEVNTGANHYAVDYALTTDFVWGLGLFDRIQIGVAIPLVDSQSGEGISALVANGGPATQLPQTALRDLRFDVGVALVQRARRTNADGPGLRIDLGGAAPIGDHENFEGAPGWTFQPMLVGDYRWHGFTATANVGARIRDQAAVADIVWGSQGVLGIGLAYRPPALDRLMVGADFLALIPLYGSLQETNTVGSGQAVTTYNPFTPMELFYGARYAVDRGRDIEVMLGGGAPIGKAPTVPEFRIIAALSYTPRGLDNDGDGVPDTDDECPTVPEDRDGYQDQDGCPDPDNDGDHIPDVTDRCPNEPEDVDNFEDDDGCPDPDNDQDGVPDPEDECATEAAGAHPDPAHPGCPIRDRDRDGVLDSQDLCPDLPAGDHPDPARPGCPLPDRDHDGVPDDQDQCPSDPAGDHPDAYRPGCPDPDRDHDGVPNVVDQCPDQPETINGVADDDGCPDEGPEATHWAGNVIIFERVIHLPAGLRAIAPADAGVLAQAAQRIRGRGAGIDRVDVRVTPGPGRRGETEAARLAGLAAAVLTDHGIPREQIDAGAAQVPHPGQEGMGVMHAGRPPGTPQRPLRVPAGELRLSVRMRPRLAGPSISIGPAGSTGRPATVPMNASPAPGASSSVPEGASPAPASASPAPGNMAPSSTGPADTVSPSQSSTSTNAAPSSAPPASPTEPTSPAPASSAPTNTPERAPIIQ